MDFLTQFLTKANIINCKIISMINPRTNHIVKIKLGFAYSILLFSWLFGYPLYVRKLYKESALIFVLFFANYNLFFILPLSYTVIVLFVLFNFVIVGLSIYFAFKGDRATIENYYFNLGYEFVDANSAIVKDIRQKYNIYNRG